MGSARTALRPCWRRISRPRLSVRTPPSSSGDGSGRSNPSQTEAAPPILAYRVATCGVAHRPALEALRTAVPEFVETSFFLGQIAVPTIADGGAGDPHALVAEALQRLPSPRRPRSSALSLQHAVADWDRAIELYDRTLALKPLHEDAWAGRTISLTELARHGEAIDAATRMIVLKLDNVDQALYWRAWNHHAQGELAAARADIEEAKSAPEVGRDPHACGDHRTRSGGPRIRRPRSQRGAANGAGQQLPRGLVFRVGVGQAAAMERRRPHVRGRDDLLCPGRDKRARHAIRTLDEQDRHRPAVQAEPHHQVAGGDSGAAPPASGGGVQCREQLTRNPAISRKRGR